MPKLEKTPERMRVIAETHAEWLAAGLSTTPGDFEAAEGAIARMYERIGKKRPYFVKLASPMAAELYINLYSQVFSAPEKLMGQLGDQLRDQLRGQLRGQLWGQLRGQLWGQLGDQLRDQLKDQLGGQLRGHLGDQLVDQLVDQLGGQLWDQLWDQLGDQLRDQLRDQLWGQLRGQLWGQLGDQLRDQLKDQLGGQLGGQLRGQKLKFTGTWFWGAWDYYWMWLDGGRRVGAIYSPALNDALDDHCTVVRNIGWWYPFNDFVILTDRPETLAINDQGRLHSDAGPALRYRDGYSLWFLNGLPTTQKLVEAPETVTAAEVRDERNAELRRHMLDRYAGLRGSAAMGKWLLDIGATAISEADITDKMQPSGLSIWRLSNGDAPVLCKLYRADLQDDEPLNLLFVICTSTAKEVFLRVPPNIHSAAEARDWTFGVALAEAVET